MTDEDIDIRENIGVVYDSNNFPEYLTAKQLADILGRIYSKWDDFCFEQFLRRFGLPESQKIKSYSRGMSMKLAIAVALSHDSKLLILDEATSGLDPTTSKSIHVLLQELKQAGTTIFLTTHDMNEATVLCDQLSLLNKGNLIEYGSPQEIIQKYHEDKKVRLRYQDGREQVVPFEELPHLNTTNLIAVHSCEPTLEEIFIRLTGEKLDV